MKNLRLNTVLPLALLSGLMITSSCSSELFSDSKVIGGEKTENPGFFVTLHSSFDSKGDRPNCGGTLIREDVVVTAAHCISTFVNTVFFKRNGVVESRKIQTVKKHERYLPDPSVKHDLALIFLKGGGFRGLDTVSPAFITSSSNERLKGALGRAYGVGQMTSIGSMLAKDGLRMVDLPVVDRSICTKGLKSVSDLYTVHKEQICTQVKGGGKDTCQGDSGGPLVLRESDELIGVTSFGWGCAQPDQGGVFTAVSHYQSWIKDKIAIWDSELRPDDISRNNADYLKRKISLYCSEGLSLSFDLSNHVSSSADSSHYVNVSQSTILAQPLKLTESESISFDEVLKPVCRFYDGILGDVSVYETTEDIDFSEGVRSFAVKASEKTYIAEFAKQESRSYFCEIDRLSGVKVTDNQDGVILVRNQKATSGYKRSYNIFSGYFTKTQSSCAFKDKTISFEETRDEDGVLGINSVVITNKYGIKTKFLKKEFNVGETKIEASLTLNEKGEGELSLANDSDHTLYSFRLTCSKDFVISLGEEAVASYQTNSGYWEASLEVSKFGELVTLPRIAKRQYGIVFSGDGLGDSELTCKVNGSIQVSLAN